VVIAYCKLSKGRLCPLFTRPEFSTASVPWPVSYGRVLNDIEEKSPLLFAETDGLSFCTRGKAPRTGDIEDIETSYIASAGIRMCCPLQLRGRVLLGNQIPGHLLAVAIDTSKLRHIAPAESMARRDFWAPPLLYWRMPEVGCTGQGANAPLRQKAGCPGGRLFGESLSLALLSYLAGNYAERRPTIEATLAFRLFRRSVSAFHQRESGHGLSRVSDLAACIGVKFCSFLPDL